MLREDRDEEKLSPRDNSELGGDDEEEDEDEAKLEEDELQSAEVRDRARRISTDELNTIDITGKGGSP